MSIEIKKIKGEEKATKACNKKINKNKYFFNMTKENRNKIYKIKKEYEKYLNSNNYNHNMDLIFKNKMQIFNFLLILISIILYPSICLSQKYDLRQLSTFQEIKMTIQGIGNQYILSPDFQYEKDKIESIIINNDSQTNKSKIQFDLNSTINNITIVWNSKLENINQMFSGLSNITYIDFSNFDSSEVKNMSNLFYNCDSLTSVDLTNFNTSLVSDMSYVFNGCSSLIELNLNKFNTSRVQKMSYMFNGCSALTSLDLNNFETSKVKYMENMFCDCKSLTSLNIINFDTSSVSKMTEMFRNCSKLVSLDLSHFRTSNLSSLHSMFYGCESLISLNLSSFDTSKITRLAHFFKECYSLKSLNLTNFNTSSVESMDELFYECNSLESLNIKSFDTSLVTDMSEMFFNCQSLKSLDISNFRTKSCKNMYRMFCGCSSLISLDLSNFDTSSVNHTGRMFYNCSSLISLNINNFNTSLFNNTGNMFNGCRSLISLNIKNFDISRNATSSDMFSNINENLIYCVNDVLYDNIKGEFPQNSTFNCSDVCFTNSQHKLIKEKNKCIDECHNDDTYKIEYNNICYKTCPNGTHNSSNNNFTCEEEEKELQLICDNYYNYNHTECLESIPEGYYLNDSVLKTIDKCNIKCRECNNESNSYNICVSCNVGNNYFQKENDSSNTGSFINCYNREEDGYYLDSNNSIYKLCYHSCKKCNGTGDENSNKCTECYDNYKLTEDSNCVLFESEKISEEQEIDSLKTIVIESTELTEKKEKEENEEKEETNEITEKEQNKESDTNMNLEIDKIIKELVNSSQIINPSFYYYDLNIESSDLEKSYINSTYIDFLKEEKQILFNKFNLDQEKDKINIIIIDYPSNDIKSAISDYTFKLFLENGTELNLSIIEEDFSVDIYCPIRNETLSKYNYSVYFAEQGYDIYNKSGDFYNNICSPAFIHGNDIILSDRKNDIYPNNVTICKQNCEYKKAILDNKKIVCKCQLNNNKKYENEDNNFLLEEKANFWNYILDNINYKIFKCYNLFLSLDNIKENFGFYISIIIFISITLNILIFYFCGIPKIIRLMNKTIPKEENLKNEIKKQLSKYKKRKRKSKNIFTRNKSKSKSKTMKLLKTKSKSSSINRLSSRKVTIFSQNKCSINNNREISENEDINELPFSLALIKDKRNAFQIFLSVIIKKLDLINIIYGEEKVKLVLIFQFILSLIIDFFFNTLLFSDEIISHKYHNNGKLDILVSILLSLISNIITSMICYFLNFSKGVEERIEQITEIKREYKYLLALHKFLKILKIRILLCIIFEIIFIIFFFYYEVIFCSIYSNSQVNLLVNYLISLIDNLIISIIITILVVITRKIGINFSKSYIYNTSKFINNKF